MFVVDKVVSACLATGIIEHFLQFSGLVGRSVKAIKDVVTDVTREQNRLLLNDCNLLVVPLRVESADVAAVEQDFSIARLVELLD